MDAFGIENHGYSPLISQKYVVKGDFEVYDGMDLLHHAMLNTLPNINKDGGKDEHGKTIRIPDFEARQKADTLITEIRQAFVEWLHAQPDDFKERLTDLYNRKFNCYVRPRYDGSHQQFPGLDLRGLGIEDLYPSQKDAIWMIKQNGGGICDHEVLRPYRAYSKCRSGNLPGKGFRCRSLANLSTQPKGGGECRMLETA